MQRECKGRISVVISFLFISSGQLNAFILHPPYPPIPNYSKATPFTPTPSRSAFSYPIARSAGMQTQTYQNPFGFLLRLSTSS